MKNMKTKIVKHVMIFIILIFVLFSGMVNQLTYAQAVDKPFALVDQDTGVEVDSKTIYYAKEMLKNINDSNLYKITNLTDAKEGVSANNYCGYIVIPNNFSKNIESITNHPSKTTILYALNKNFDSDNTITKLNRIVGELDTNIATGYVNTLLNDVNSVTNNINGVIDTIKTQTISINGIRNFDYIKTLELNPNKQIVLNQEDINKAVNELNSTDEDISSQLSKSILTENNEDRKNLSETISGLNISIDDLKNAQYFRTELSSISLVEGFSLIGNNNQPLNVLFNKTTGAVFVEQINDGYLVVKNGAEQYGIGNVEKNQYVDVNEINNEIIKIQNDKNETNLSILGNDLIIYGSNVDVSINQNIICIDNAKSIIFNGSYYYPDPNGVITFDILTSGQPIDDLKNQLIEQVNYNKLSSSIIQTLSELNKNNPNIELQEALNNLLSDQEINNYFIPLSDQYQNNIMNYVNNISPSYFDNIIYSISNNNVVMTNINEAKNALPDRITIKIKEYQSIPQNTNYFEQIKGNVIDSNLVLDIAPTQSLMVLLADQLSIYENNIPGLLNYDNLYLNVSNIFKQINNYNVDTNKQIEEINKNTMDNTTKIAEYIASTQEDIKNNTNNIVNDIIVSNDANINKLSSEDQRFDYLRDGNSVNYQLVEYMVNSLDLRNETINNQEKERKNNYMLYVPAIVIITMVLGYVLYKQGKRVKEGGD